MSPEKLRRHVVAAIIERLNGGLFEEKVHEVVRDKIGEGPESPTDEEVTEAYESIMNNVTLYLHELGD